MDHHEVAVLTLDRPNFQLHAVPVVPQIQHHVDPVGVVVGKLAMCDDMENSVAADSVPKCGVVEVDCPPVIPYIVSYTFYPHKPRPCHDDGSTRSATGTRSGTLLPASIDRGVRRRDYSELPPSGHGWEPFPSDIPRHRSE